MYITEIKQNIIHKLNSFKDDELVIELEYPQEFKNGHLSTNFALKNSKSLQSNPRDIAMQVTKLFSEDEFIDKVDVAGPGFINFFLKDEVIKDLVNTVINDELILKQYEDNHKYNIEYVSANPTGDLHLGHARIGVYGDSTMRVLKAAGYDVTSEFYINDAGNQMKNLGLSVKYFYEQLLNIESEFPEDGYQGEEIKSIANSLYEKDNDKHLNDELDFFINYAYKVNMQEIKDILKKLNIEFDVFTSEKTFHENNSINHSLEVLEKLGATYEKDGALWLASTKYGDDKDRVLRKSDGTLTYLTSDIAYHLNKFERGYDKIFDILGGDHHGYVARLKASIEALGENPDDFDVSLVQMVNIMRNNEAVKMSKRAGTSVTIKHLLDEIDSEAIRYFFVMRSPDTQLDFDLDVTTKQNSENPVYYIQYAHARISSILKTANEQNIKIEPISEILNETEQEIILKLATYTEVVNESARKRLPHILANYLYDVASLYHSYYNQERVFGEHQNTKLNINIAVKRVIKDGLSLIGIDAKDEMHKEKK